jgi:hypothetical protein
MGNGKTVIQLMTQTRFSCISCRNVITGLSWVMLELGNALGFLVGPILIPNPPSKTTKNIEKNVSDIAQNEPYIAQNVSSFEAKVEMREDIMHLMYLRTYISGY